MSMRRQLLRWYMPIAYAATIFMLSAVSAPPPTGWIRLSDKFLHFGAVSARRPEGLYAERCVKLGQNIASKAMELFG